MRGSKIRRLSLIDSNGSLRSARLACSQTAANPQIHSSSLANFHLSYTVCKNQHADLACIAPKSLQPLIPPSVINLRPADSKASSIFQLSLFWNPPPCVPGAPFPTPPFFEPPVIFHLHISSREGVHTDSQKQLLGSATRSFDSAEPVQNNSAALRSPQNDSAAPATCWSGKRWQWPLEERLTRQLPVGSVAAAAR